MKKTVVFLMLFILIPATSYANNIVKQYEKIGINEIIDVESEIFPDFDPAETVKKLSEGDGFDTKHIIKSLLDFFLKEFKSVFKLCTVVLIIGYLSGILNALESSFYTKGTTLAALMVVYAVFAGVTVSVFTELIKPARECIYSLCLMIKSAVPVLISLLTVSGNLTGASLMQPVLMTLVTVIQEIISKAVFPLILCSAALSVANNMSDKINVKISVGLLRQAAKWIMVFCMAIYTGFFGIYGVCGTSIDRTIGKAAKFAVGSFVPVVGGVVADSIETVMTTLSAVKNITGVLCVASIVLTMISPILKTAAAMWCFKLCVAALEPVADRRSVKLAMDISECISLTFSILMCIMILFSGCVGILLMSSNIIN